MSVRCRLSTCPADATHYPGAMVWAVGRRGMHKPIQAVLNVPLCRHHAKRRDWFTEKVVAAYEDQIRRQYPRLLPRDWERAQFAPVSIKDGDHGYSRTPEAPNEARPTLQRPTLLLPSDVDFGLGFKRRAGPGRPGWGGIPRK